MTLIMLTIQKQLFILISMFIESLIMGTFLYVTYPIIHVLFPTAANEGLIATHLGWFASVGIVFVIKLLFKSEVNIENKTFNLKDENKS